MTVVVRYHTVTCVLCTNMFPATAPSGTLTSEAVYGLKLAAVLSPWCHLRHKCLHVCSHGSSHFTQKSLVVALHQDTKLLLNHVSCRELLDVHCYPTVAAFKLCCLSVCMASTWCPTVVSGIPLQGPLMHCSPRSTGNSLHLMYVVMSVSKC